MASRTFIQDFKGNELVDGVFAIQNTQLGQTRNGKPFLKCLIADRTGRVAARMWNVTEELYNDLPTNGFVWIDGQTQPYQGEIQLIIQRIKPCKPNEGDLTDLIPTTRHDIGEMFASLTQTLAEIQHPAIRALIQQYLEDESLMEAFRYAPAAQTLHHAFVGGLLEHTLALTRLADAVLPLYPEVNRDIVLAGLFLHDLGKCAELTWREGMGYSDDGQLVGHIARGVIWLEEKARQAEAGGTRIPAPILRVLHHIILSHHSRPEFGALKIPATPEALLVALLDNVDAKMHMALGATGRTEADQSPHDPESGLFTEKIWALETRFYRPDPTTLPDDAP